MSKDSPISETYRAALWRALICSLVIGLLFGLVDDYQTPWLTAVGLALFWTLVVVIICRRPQTPTKLDLLAIRWGWLPLIVGFQVLIRFVWHWRGLE